MTTLREAYKEELEAGASPITFGGTGSVTASTVMRLLMEAYDRGHEDAQQLHATCISSAARWALADDRGPI